MCPFTWFGPKVWRVTNSIDEIDAVLSRTQPVSEYTSLDSLREWRGELVHTSVYVSYAIGVLSLDEEILEQTHSATDPHDLQLLVDRLSAERSRLEHDVASLVYAGTRRCARLRRQ